jgi:ATP-binding cassette subfamily B protein
VAEIELEEEEYTSQITGKTLRRILGLTRSHWHWVAGFWVMIAFTSILDAVFTYLNKNIIDQGIVAQNHQALIHILELYGGLIFVQAVCVFSFIYLSGVLGERIQYDLRRSMFNHLQELSLAYYSQTSVGRLMARVTSDSGRVSDLVTWGLVDSTWAVMNITTSMIFMMVINWKLALMIFVIVPILLAIAIQFRKKILVEFRNSRRANSKITGSFNENISGVRVVSVQLSCSLAICFIFTYRSNHICPGIGIYCLVWWKSSTHRCNDHWWNPGICQLLNLYDVAGARPGAGICRDAAFHRIS